MINDRRVLAIVPARGGSKGVLLKNIRSILGKSLIARVAETVEEAGFVDCSVISTDHKEIRKEAIACGLLAPFVRPPELSGDRVADWPVLVHALREMEKHNNVAYDIVLMLQPTSPLRNVRHLRAAIDKLIDGEFDSVWTLSETDSKSHPLKQLEVSDDGTMEYYDQRGKEIVARQDLTPLYHRNGACYAITRECLLDQGSIKGGKAGAVITEPMISIDTLLDFRLTEILMSEPEPKLSQFPLPGGD